MRIIAGYLKGKKIDFLKSSITRPLRDYVKENIFNVINHSNLVDIDLENANVLDLYSGVGSFGVECISRGSKKITFIENDKIALDALKKNLKNLNIEDKCKIFENKIIRFFDQTKNKDKYEIFFFDPPFDESFIIEDLEILKNLKIFKKKHLIIIHRDQKSKDNLNKIMNIFLIKKYGRSKIIFGDFNLSAS